jgi:hypothetical protein
LRVLKPLSQISVNAFKNLIGMYAAAPKNLRLSIPNWAATPVAPVQIFPER